MTEWVALPKAAAALIASISEAAAKSNSTWTIRLSATSNDATQQTIDGFFDIEPSVSQQQTSNEPALPIVQPIKLDLNLHSLQDTLAVRLRTKGITRKTIGGIDIVPYLATFLTEVHLRGGPANVKDWAGIATTLGMKGQNRGNLLKKFYQEYLTDDQLDNTVIVPAVPHQINSRSKGMLAAFTAPIPQHPSKHNDHTSPLYIPHKAVINTATAASHEDLQIAAILPATKAQNQKKNKKKQHPQTPQHHENAPHPQNDAIAEATSSDGHEVQSKAPINQASPSCHPPETSAPNKRPHFDHADEDDDIIENDNIFVVHPAPNKDAFNRTPIQGNDDYHFPESDGEDDYGPQSPGSKRHRAFAAVALLCDDLMEEKIAGEDDDDDDTMDVHVDEDGRAGTSIQQQGNGNSGNTIKRKLQSTMPSTTMQAGGLSMCLPFLEPWLPVS